MAIEHASNSSATTHSSRSGKTNMPYIVEEYVDFAEVTVTKGSAIAAADIIECITVPNGAYLLMGGIEVIVATDAGTADLTLDWGYGGDDDLFVVAMDCDGGTAVGAVSTPAVTNLNGVEVTAAVDTLDLVVAGSGVDVTTGVVRVWALILDTTERSNDLDVAARDQV